MDQGVVSKLNKFFQKYKTRKYKKGEVLIRGGDEPAGLFFLKEGVVRQYIISFSGEEVTLNIFKPLSFFPMSWAINDSSSIYHFEAMGAATVGIAPKQDFLKFIKKEPDVLLDLVKRIYRGLDGYFIRMEYSMFGDARSRLIVELLIWAKRFGQKKGHSLTVNFKLTEKDLAAQIGIARETVSREIQKLKQAGLIEFHKNILVINNLERLQNEL